jgi:hypothetical protein
MNIMAKRVIQGLMVPLAAVSVHAAEFRVPLMKQAPTIDGNIDPAEWATAAGLDGLVRQTELKLEPRRVKCFVGATETTIYVAIQSQLPDEGQLLTRVDSDSLKVAYDDSLEVYICPAPNSNDKVDYQFIENSAGKCGYNIHLSGNAQETPSWSGNWKHANGLHDGWWHFECAIPIESMGTVTKGRKTTDGVWAINATRNWRPDWSWTSLGGGYANSGLPFVFTSEPAPAVQFAWKNDPCFPPAEGTLTISNPSTKPLQLNAVLQTVRNRMPEMKEEKALTLAPGQSETLKQSLTENDPTTYYDQLAQVTSSDGTNIYYKRATQWKRSTEKTRWVTEKPKESAPVDFRFAYYPSKNKMRVAADISGLPKDAKPSNVTATIRTKADKKVVKTVSFPIDQFKDGRQELVFQLPAIEGEFEIALKVEGENAPKNEAVQSFERKKFPWEHTQLGTSTKVYPPFTPIVVEGKKLSTVLRDHTLNDVGLLDQVTATSANTKISKAILAAPMRYVVKIGGADTPVAAKPMKVVSAKPDQAVVQGSFAAGSLNASWKDVWEYDGAVKVDLTIQTTDKTPVTELTLEIPFSNDTAPLIHANSDRIRAPVAEVVPKGSGKVWDATKVACDDYIKNFAPYVYLGSGIRGLCWFAENDKGWGWNPETPNVEVVRRGDQVVMVVHLINKPTVLDKPQTLSFGLLAAPVKPPYNGAAKGPNWWRYRYYRDLYDLLGTDINWLALGDCGSVYPAGQDMYLWQMLAVGNREHISTTDYDAVVAKGRKYFEPYGAGVVDHFVQHCGNLRSRYGEKMVFYYNRATCQLFPETETFKDEWLLDDYRGLGKGISRGEIKTIPSQSFIDYNLYWYVKSFEIGNNQGVYWDNYFICPSFNTEMTDAYRRPDGTIAPASGIWGLRELSKRTFIMENERGMQVFTFPHMTSFSCLPMLSFATCQLDWEWKCSEGDVQNRFTREYLQLASDGELSGAWPVALHEQAGQGADQRENQWVQRTFTAVRLVHELDGVGGFGKHYPAHEKVAKPVIDILDSEGLKVYKYWEERPQPVKATSADFPCIVYSVPGKEAVVVVTSYAGKDDNVSMTVDAKALGFTGGWITVNTETGAAVAATDGRLTFALKMHDMCVLRLTATQK